MIESLSITMPSLLAAATGGAGTDAEGGVGSAIQLTAVGMLVVFTALTLLMLVVTLIARDWSSSKPKAAPLAAAAPSVAEAQAEPVEAPAEIEEGISPETLVVITAAVAAQLGQGFKLQAVRRFIQPTDGWRQHGRRSLVTGRRPSQYHN